MIVALPWVWCEPRRLSLRVCSSWLSVVAHGSCDLGSSCQVRATVEIPCRDGLPEFQAGTVKQRRSSSLLVLHVLCGDAAKSLPGLAGLSWQWCPPRAHCTTMAVLTNQRSILWSCRRLIKGKIGVKWASRLLCQGHYRRHCAPSCATQAPSAWQLQS